MTSNLKRTLIAGAGVAVLAGAGAAVAGATGGDGDGTPITGRALDRARAVALAHTGGGRVTATELRDEEGYYEVEVTRADGSEVDVHLDQGFRVLDASGDGAGDGTDAGSK